MSLDQIEEIEEVNIQICGYPEKKIRKIDEIRKSTIFSFGMCAGKGLAIKS